LTALSHNWSNDEQGRSNHARVKRIKLALDKAGYRPWFDEEEMAGDINKKMADGVDASKAVVVFVTREYVRKVAGDGPNGSDDNCKYEFDYALMRKGVERLITVVMEPSARNPREWRGPVGGKLGTRLFVDLSDDEPRKFAEGVQHLIAEMGRVTGVQRDAPLEHTVHPKKAFVRQDSDKAEEEAIKQPSHGASPSPSQPAEAEVDVPQSVEALLLKAIPTLSAAEVKERVGLFAKEGYDTVDDFVSDDVDVLRVAVESGKLKRPHAARLKSCVDELRKARLKSSGWVGWVRVGLEDTANLVGRLRGLAGLKQKGSESE